MIRDSFPAMGTTAEVIVESTEMLRRARGWFAMVEERFSRFLPDSELSLINSSDRSSIDVSPAMADVLSLAAEMRERTEGVVDPSVGQAVIDWGYEKTFDQVEDLKSAPPAQSRGSWSIHGKTLMKEPSTRLDLGGIVKGWVADRAVEDGLCKLASVGGDMRSIIANAEAEVVDDLSGNSVIVRLGEGGLATSSTTTRRWLAGGKAAHHLIDPRTMAPARTPSRTTTALCDSAVEAEAAAKAVLIHGEDGLRWADSTSWVRAAMATWHDGSTYATKGWEMAA